MLRDFWAMGYLRISAGPRLVRTVLVERFVPRWPPLLLSANCAPPVVWHWRRVPPLRLDWWSLVIWSARAQRMKRPLLVTHPILPLGCKKLQSLDRWSSPTARKG